MMSMRRRLRQALSARAGIGLGAALVLSLTGERAHAPRMLAADALPPRASAADALPAGRPSAAGPATGDARAIASVLGLQTDLDRILRRGAWPGSSWSVLVVSLEDGDTLFSHAPDEPLKPASNLKLFTSAAAFRYLGPDFRYQTYVMTAAPIREGVVEGDLILYGTGDPTISDRLYHSKTEVWQELVDSLLARGIHEVTGDVVGDATYFDGTDVGVGWKLGYVDAWYAAPASALSFGEAMVSLSVHAAEREGWRPVVETIPDASGIAVVNRARTVATGPTIIEAGRLDYDGPIVVSGQIRRGHRAVWRLVPVADPARYAAASFRQVLLAAGIQVDGGVRSIHDPSASPVTSHRVFAPALTGRAAPRVLAVHHSPPMLDIVTVLNKHSHNLYAEQLLRTVGRVTAGTGSVRAGKRAVSRMLSPNTSGSFELRMLDGSGLSGLDRTDARTIVHLLTGLRNQPFFDDFASTLPEAGGVGLYRMHRTLAVHNLIAKTGTLDSVSALSGYVRARDGEQLVFSIISNGVPSTWRAKRIEDAIGARLARFDRPFPTAPVLAASTPTSAGSGAPVDSATTRPAAGGTVDDTPQQDSVAGSYIVRPGDTLDGIARRFGLSLPTLRSLNPGLEPRRLVPGQTVRVSRG
jgi:serine-type D-Ala-D-Ala carboxypeptidase/endopeptidase (penicillin-binding protein 4)